MSIQEGNLRLSADDRREEILKILSKLGKVKVAELSRRFNVSEVSIRNDLDELERAGYLKRIHGGAVSVVGLGYNRSYEEKVSLCLEEKKRIARAAVELISPGSSILLDGGTTTLQMVPLMREIHNIVVITNSPPNAMDLGISPSVDVILLGGDYKGAHKTVCGPMAIEQLRRFKTDYAFLGADGITASEGITTPNVFEAEMARVMIERARQVVLVADSSKIGKIGLAWIAPAESIDILITDEGADREEVEALRNLGIDVRLV